MKYLLEQQTKKDLLDKVKPGVLPKGIKQMYALLFAESFSERETNAISMPEPHS